eukprot:CAMPEP_0176148470 /NCGR_PEP_ID=MMETSP0120_2-20121206/75715_1 /TAXON_ID=160619 /ORGANISM="Kryptoperidinium foliaceum, Strain CCMP 1326" /LENGTH=34 /DNA_ID= /DNA_START= /DNA_END= /DNA_ORIENTATION=
MAASNVLSCTRSVTPDEARLPRGISTAALVNLTA